MEKKAPGTDWVLRAKGSNFFYKGPLTLHNRGRPRGLDLPLLCFIEVSSSNSNSPHMNSTATKNRGRSSRKLQQDCKKFLCVQVGRDLQGNHLKHLKTLTLNVFHIWWLGFLRPSPKRNLDSLLLQVLQYVYNLWSYSRYILQD